MRADDRDAVLNYLHLMRGVAKGNGADEGPHGCGAAFELAHGRFFPSQAYDRNRYGPAGRPRECIKNAALLAKRHGLIYAEGHCLSRIGFPVLHAFCLDGEGRVVDPTWPDPCDCLYHGVTLKADKVIEHHIASRMHVSMLDDFHNRWPLVRGVLPLEEWAA